MTPAYLVFHLNMAFSSIPEERREEVIRKCYHPVLDLGRRGRASSCGRLS
ncbi:MAG: hypothetical protein U5K31_02490 [Balneolaceae bacterium]|nr:hypothetical protein [Balneolaceae bacterium]